MKELRKEKSTFKSYKSRKISISKTLFILKLWNSMIYCLPKYIPKLYDHIMIIF